jgi:hypothetical protein
MDRCGQEAIRSCVRQEPWMLHRPPGVVYLETPVRKTQLARWMAGGVTLAFFPVSGQGLHGQRRRPWGESYTKRKTPGEKHGHWIFRV